MKKVISLFLVFTMLLISTSNVFAENRNQMPSKNKSWNMQLSIEDLNRVAQRLENFLNDSNIDAEKKKEIRNMYNETIRMIKRLESKRNTSKSKESDLISFSDGINLDIWDYFNEGDTAYHSHESTNLPGNFASIRVNSERVTWTGFDWSGTSYSRWIGTDPSEAYEIQNTITLNVKGVAISGSLNGISFSGATSAKAIATDSNRDDWRSTISFDAHTGPSTMWISFESSSSVKLTSNSTKDITSAKITIWEPTF